MLSVFLLTVFFLCVTDYEFITAPLVIAASLIAGLAVLRVFAGKAARDKIMSVCGYCILFLSAALAAILYCALYFNVFQKPAENYLEKYKDTPVHIKAEIMGASGVNYVSTFDLKVFEVDGEKTKKFNLSLSIYGEIGAGPDDVGSILETYVIFRNLEDDVFDGVGTAYYKSGGYYISAEHVSGDEDEAADYTITPSESRSLYCYLEDARRYTGEVFFKHIRLGYRENITDEAAVVYGLFTGNKNYISQPIKNDFRRAGIAHVLSVSGFHLSILCGIIFAFLNLLKTHKKIAAVIVILCCLAFMAFTGFSLPILRAGIMMILFYAAFLLGRKSDPFTSLFAAGTFIILLNPYNILNLGFQLSFSATLGIISTSGLNNKIMQKLDEIKRFAPLIKILKFIISSFIITIAATVFTLPFIAYSFKALSLISPITNLLTAPLVTAILFCALCAMILSFAPFLLVIFCLPVYYITKLLLAVTKYLGSFKYSYISVESTIGSGFYVCSVVFIVFVVLCFLAPPFFTGAKAKKIVRAVLYSLTALALLVMAGTLIYPRILFGGSVRFAYYSDNRNQNIIIFNDDYDSVDIIDMTHGTLSHIRPVYNIISGNGAMYINSVVLTDYRKRHVQMIKRYMNYSEVKRVYIPGPASEYDAEVYNLLYYLSVDLGFELINYGTALDLDGVIIAVNTFDYKKMLHQAVDINCGGKRLLYLGIGYKEGYAEYTNINSRDYDVVFYGTHKHNRRDDDYVSDISGSYAGVLSSYLDNEKNRTVPKLELSAIEAYISGSVLFLSDSYKSIVFEVRKNGGMRHYLK